MNITRRDFIYRSLVSMGLGVGALNALTACKKKEAYNYPIGVCDWSIGAAGNPTSLDIAKKIGLDGVQISSAKKKPEGDFYTKEEIAAYKAKMAETGMKIASTSPTCMNTNPFYLAKGTVEFTCSAIDAAAELGSDCILLPFYGPANMQKPDKKMNEAFFKPLVERLKEVAPYAEKKGVMVALENSISAEENLKVLDAVGSNMVNVYFDIFNFQFYGHETLPALKALKGRIGQIHLKDAKHKLDSNSEFPRKMNEVLATIAKDGYKGWMVLESHGFSPKKEGYSDADLFKHNAEFARNFYANLK